MHKLAASRSQSATVSPVANLKPMEEYSDSHHTRRKRQISNCCNSSLQWLQGQGYLPVSVTVVSMATGDKEYIDCLAELFRHEETIDVANINIVNMMLYLKDCHNISHETSCAKICHDTTNLNRKFPS